MNTNGKDIQYSHSNYGQYRTLPVIAYGAICLLDTYITNSMKVFEWGIGGSTLFFSYRAGSVISIEHNSSWIDTISKAFELRGICKNWEIKYHPPEDGVVSGYMSGKKQYEGRNFSSYIRSIDGYEDNRFNVIMIDGRARCACMEHARSKLGSGGLLVLDNTERGEYNNAMKFYEDWHIWHYKSELPYKPDTIIETTIWQRP